MGQINATSAIAHGEDRGHAAGDAGHATVKGCLIGFMLTVILTAIPSEVMIDGGHSHQTVLVMVMAPAIVRTVMHLIYFLHLDGSFAQRRNVIAFLFTLLTLAIVVVGSLWVMRDMNASMMTM